MTLDSIFKKKAESDAAKAQAKNDIVFMEKRKAEILANAEKAADAGDEEEYIRLTDEASQLERRIYVKRKIADAARAVDPEEVEAAWSEHVAKYNKAFRAKYANFERERKRLCKMYEDMINDQYDLLQIRKRAGELIGVANLAGESTQHILSFDRLPETKEHSFKGIGSPAPQVYHCRNLAIPFFFDSDDIDPDTFEKWRDVFNLYV